MFMKRKFSFNCSHVKVTYHMKLTRNFNLQNEALLITKKYTKDKNRFSYFKPLPKTGINSTSSLNFIINLFFIFLILNRIIQNCSDNLLILFLTFCYGKFQTQSKVGIASKKQHSEYPRAHHLSSTMINILPIILHSLPNHFSLITLKKTAHIA